MKVIASIVAPTSKSKKNQGGRKKQVFFTQVADIALVKEMLITEPYAADNGQKKRKYELLTANLINHLSVKLGDLIVKNRLVLLLAEFKMENEGH